MRLPVGRWGFLARFISRKSPMVPEPELSQQSEFAGSLVFPALAKRRRTEDGVERYIYERSTEPWITPPQMNSLS